MSSTADQLAALGNDSSFRLRIQSLALQVAVTVYAEAPATPDTRRNFAKQILSNTNIAQNLANVLANRTNLVAGNTTYDFSTGHVKTDVTDAAISSQIASDWNMLAGV
jgi:hypothetical protein